MRGIGVMGGMVGGVVEDVGKGGMIGWGGIGNGMSLVEWVRDYRTRGIICEWWVWWWVNLERWGGDVGVGIVEDGVGEIDQILVIGGGRGRLEEISDTIWCAEMIGRLRHIV